MENQLKGFEMCSCEICFNEVMRAHGFDWLMWENQIKESENGNV